MLSKALEYLNRLDALFLGGQFLIPQRVHAKVNGILLYSMDLPHVFLVAFHALVHVRLQRLPELIVLLKSTQLLSIHISGVQFVEHSICAVDMRLHKLRVDNLVIIVLFCVFLVVEILLILAILLGLRFQCLINKDVVQVLEIFQFIDRLELVSLITLIAGEHIRIVGHVQDLQIVFKHIQVLNRRV